MGKLYVLLHSVLLTTILHDPCLQSVRFETSRSKIVPPSWCVALAKAFTITFFAKFLNLILPADVRALFPNFLGGCERDIFRRFHFSLCFALLLICFYFCLSRDRLPGRLSDAHPMWWAVICYIGVDGVPCVMFLVFQCACARPPLSQLYVCLNCSQRVFPACWFLNSSCDALCAAHSFSQYSLAQLIVNNYKDIFTWIQCIVYVPEPARTLQPDFIHTAASFQSG